MTTRVNGTLSVAFDVEGAFRNDRRSSSDRGDRGPRIDRTERAARRASSPASPAREEGPAGFQPSMGPFSRFRCGGGVVAGAGWPASARPRSAPRWIAGSSREEDLLREHVGRTPEFFESVGGDQIRSTRESVARARKKSSSPPPRALPNVTAIRNTIELASGNGEDNTRTAKQTEGSGGHRIPLQQGG